jgi:fermentation-respiration switch protein FrsA (DUF1100 family)
MLDRRPGMEAARRAQTLTASSLVTFYRSVSDHDSFSRHRGLKLARGAWVSPAWRLFAIVGLFPLVLCACRFEDSFIFHPSAVIERTPADVGLNFTDVYFDARDGVRLHGWFLSHAEARSTLIWFHGNAGNISHRVQNLRRLREQAKINIFIFDYRGYGRSQGRASEEGTYLDGEAAVAYVRDKLAIETNRIILFGRSLGAAVAAETASRFDIQALILESPFISIREMARAVLPMLPLGPLLQTRYDVLEKVRRIKTPILILHGDRDEVVPFSHGKAVFDAAPQPKEFYRIANAGHNDTYLIGGDTYFQKLKSFIESTALP